MVVRYLGPHVEFDQEEKTSCINLSTGTWLDIIQQIIMVFFFIILDFSVSDFVYCYLHVIWSIYLLQYTLLHLKKHTCLETDNIFCL